MSHVRRRVKIEMDWPCSSCGTNNKGRNTVCTNCGNPKEGGDKKEAYVLPADLAGAEVKDEGLRRTFNAGPNWTCKHCGSDQRRPDGACLQCGAPENDPVNPEQEHPDVTPPRPTPRRLEPVYEDPYPPAQPPTDWTPILTIGGGITAAIAVVALLFFLFWPTEKDARVASIHWTYTSELHQRLVNTGEGWKKDAPGGIYAVSCEKRKNGTHDCNPHDCECRTVYDTCYDQCPNTGTVQCNPHDCNCHIDRSSCVEDGAGGADCDEVCDTCYDDCPATGTHDCNPHDCNPQPKCNTCYDQCDTIEEWCTYKYDTWPVIDTKVTSGSSHEVAWPPLAADGSNDQRLDRTETYEVVLTDEKERWTYHPTALSDFLRFTTGEGWRVKVSLAGGCDPIAPLAATTSP